MHVAFMQAFVQAVLLTAVVYCDVTRRRLDVTDSLTICGFVNSVYNKLKDVKCFIQIGCDE